MNLLTEFSLNPYEDSISSVPTSQMKRSRLRELKFTQLTDGAARGHPPGCPSGTRHVQALNRWPSMYTLRLGLKDLMHASLRGLPLQSGENWFFGERADKVLLFLSTDLHITHKQVYHIYGVQIAWVGWLGKNVQKGSLEVIIKAKLRNADQL